MSLMMWKSVVSFWRARCSTQFIFCLSWVVCRGGYFSLKILDPQKSHKKSHFCDRKQTLPFDVMNNCISNDDSTPGGPKKNRTKLCIIMQVERSNTSWSPGRRGPCRASDGKYQSTSPGSWEKFISTDSRKSDGFGSFFNLLWKKASATVKDPTDYRI